MFANSHSPVFLFLLSLTCRAQVIDTLPGRALLLAFDLRVWQELVGSLKQDLALSHGVLARTLPGGEAEGGEERACRERTDGVADAIR